MIGRWCSLGIWYTSYVPAFPFPLTFGNYSQWSCRITATASGFGENLFRLQHHRYLQAQSRADHTFFMSILTVRGDFADRLFYLQDLHLRIV